MEPNKEKEESKSHIYVVDGKEWIIGERKISKWSKAKCNQPIKDKEDKDKDLNVSLKN